MNSIHIVLLITFLSTAVLAAPGENDEWPLKGLPDEAQLAYQALCRSDVFAFGPVGFAAETSEGELAMRILARYPNAVTIFELVTNGATAEGKLYALVALRALNREAYQAALEVLPQGGRVYLQAGCVGHKEPITDVLKRIEAGSYDDRVPKPK